MENKDQLHRAIEALENNPELVARLEGATDLESTQKILEEAGIELSVSDLIEYHLSKNATELAEKELESVAGGASWCILISCIVTNTKPSQETKPTPAK